MNNFYNFKHLALFENNLIKNSGFWLKIKRILKWSTRHNNNVLNIHLIIKYGSIIIVYTI